MERKDLVKLMSMAPMSLSAMKIPEFDTSDGVPSEPEQAVAGAVYRTRQPDGHREELATSVSCATVCIVSGCQLEKEYDVQAVLVVSAHWLTKVTFVNVSPKQEQIYDYYGLPDDYYTVQYHAQGAPEVAKEVTKIVPSVTETTDWGLDHGAWPMLMHLFP